MEHRKYVDRKPPEDFLQNYIYTLKCQIPEIWEEPCDRGGLENGDGCMFTL